MTIYAKQIGKKADIANITTSGEISLAATADRYSHLNISQTTADISVTLPDGPSATPYSIAVTNTGTAAIALHGLNLPPNETAIATWSGSTYSVLANGAGGASTVALKQLHLNAPYQNNGAGGAVVFEAVTNSGTSEGGYAINVARNTITLPAGSTYEIEFAWRLTNAGITGSNAFHIRDITAGEDLGRTGHAVSNSYNGNDSARPISHAIFTPTVDTEIQIIQAGPLGEVDGYLSIKELPAYSVIMPDVVEVIQKGNVGTPPDGAPDVPTITSTTGATAGGGDNQYLWSKVTEQVIGQFKTHTMYFEYYKVDGVVQLDFSAIFSDIFNVQITRMENNSSDIIGGVLSGTTLTIDRNDAINNSSPFFLMVQGIPA